MNNKKYRIIKEPILLFFGLGILLFIGYMFLAGFYENQNKKIVVTDAQIEFLKETFQKTWNRDPTEKEMNVQVENYVKDEVFFREAVAMGLDKTDPAVKRRLRQLMEIMMDDAAAVYPSEDQLKAYLQKNPEKFMEDPVISFKQIFFREQNKYDAENHLNNLINNIPADPEKMGSLSLMPSQFEDETKYYIDRLFGKTFTETLFTLDTGKWGGPVKSAYGWHLVYIKEIKPGSLPPLSEIWDVVEREWSVEQKQIKKGLQYNQMKSNYKIVFENDN